MVHLGHFPTTVVVTLDDQSLPTILFISDLITAVAKVFLLPEEFSLISPLIYHKQNMQQFYLDIVCTNTIAAAIFQFVKYGKSLGVFLLHQHHCSCYLSVHKARQKPGRFSNLFIANQFLRILWKLACAPKDSVHDVTCKLSHFK